MMADCTEKRFEHMLYAYELGMLSEEQRRELELHLLDCDSCHDKVAQFESTARLLRHDADIRSELDLLAGLEGDAIHQEETSETSSGFGRFLRVGLAAAAVLAILLVKPWQFDIRSDQPAIAAENRLLVLSFENLAEPDDTDRFGEAVASLLVTDMSESKFVSVVSSQHLRDIEQWLARNHEDLSPDEKSRLIAGRAGARWLLQGKIIRDQQSIVLLSELSEYSSGELIASQRVTGSVTDGIFSLVDELTVKLKNDLSLPMAALQENDPRIADVTTHSQEAYFHYLEGLDYSDKMYALEAVESFKKCVELDSTFAMAFYHLAELKNKDYMDQAMSYSDQVTQKEKLYIRARAVQYDSHLDSALIVLKELVDRYPNEKQALQQMAWLEYSRHEYEESAIYLHQALKVDPLYKRALNQQAYTYDAMGH